jgi:hypothetical protein
MTAAASENGQERRHHAEVPGPRPPQRPEQVALVVLVAHHDTAVGEHYLRRHQAVRGHPVAPAEDPEAAPQRQAGDPHRRAAAARDGAAVARQRVVDGAQAGSRANGRHVPIDRHGAHRRHVDDNPAGRGMPREAVAAAADGGLEAVGREERERLHDVRGSGAQHDRPRQRVVVAGVERPGEAIEGRRARNGDLAGDRPLERPPVGSVGRPGFGAAHAAPHLPLPGVSIRCIRPSFARS